MPGLDGFGVMEGLRPQLDAAGYLPILVLTADVTDDARRRALESGARDFLTKPIDSIEVILRTRNLLETRMLYLELEAAQRGPRAAGPGAHRPGRGRPVRDARPARPYRRVPRRPDGPPRGPCRPGGSAPRPGSSAWTRTRSACSAWRRPLHDLGKIGIPDRILLAPRKLEPEEFEEMKTHTDDRVADPARQLVEPAPARRADRDDPPRALGRPRATTGSSAATSRSPAASSGCATCSTR